MEIVFDEEAKADIKFWLISGNKQVQNKISELLESILQTPFEGLGKPEALKYDLTGKWSRRINQEHRMVYEVSEDKIQINSLRGHY